MSQNQKPKKPRTSYIFFSKDHQKQLRAVGFTIPEVAKKCGEMWKALSDAEKEPYTKLWKADIKRYESQMKEFESKGFYTNSDGKKAIETDPKKRFGNDVVMPRRPVSSYTWFVKTNMKKIKDENMLDAKEAMKECSKIWKSMTLKEKKPYEKMNSDDKKR